MSLPPDTLDGLIRLGIAEALFDARTLVPAKVTKWIPEKQAIECQPLIRRKRVIDEETIEDDYPVISQVPVSFPRWGGYTIRMPLQVGDIVMLAVADREIERWLAGNSDTTLVDPRGPRTHNIDDAVAYPGFARWSNPIPDLDDGELVIGKEDGAGDLRIAADGTVTLESNAEVRLSAGGEADQHVPRGEDLISFLQQFVSTFNTHTHQVATTGDATAQTGTAAPTTSQASTPSNSILSQKTKVK